MGRFSRLELIDPLADCAVFGDATLTFCLKLAKHRKALTPLRALLWRCCTIRMDTKDEAGAADTKEVATYQRAGTFGER